ncbi:MAG: hypothetical protein ACYS83_07890 [Planctomycetota bacterium]|jgi:hypothetical protein
MATKNAMLCAFVFAFWVVSVAPAENIDPNEDGSQYAYGENVGWMNFEPSQGDGAHVSQTQLTGYVWAENIGWISLSCENTASCGTVNYGVINDGSGNLSGYAWSENAGWISFSCENTGSCGTVDYGVTIEVDGNFSGYAWGENIGWINFNSASLFGYGVKACKVNYKDLANFVEQWLETGCNAGNNWCEGADLGGVNTVDFVDYSILAFFWLDYCPDDWPLK